LALWSLDFEDFRLASGAELGPDSFGRFDGAVTAAVAMALFLKASRSRRSSEFILKFTWVCLNVKKKFGQGGLNITNILEFGILVFPKVVLLASSPTIECFFS
jgi:hypothetical protein